MEKTPAKPNVLVELTNRKMEAQKAGAATTFRKFQPNMPRNAKRGVGPSWGGRKGN